MQPSRIQRAQFYHKRFVTEETSPRRTQHRVRFAGAPQESSCLPSLPPSSGSSEHNADIPIPATNEEREAAQAGFLAKMHLLQAAWEVFLDLHRGSAGAGVYSFVLKDASGRVVWDVGSEEAKAFLASCGPQEGDAGVALGCLGALQEAGGIQDQRDQREVGSRMSRSTSGNSPESRPDFLGSPLSPGTPRGRTESVFAPHAPAAPTARSSVAYKRALHHIRKREMSMHSEMFTLKEELNSALSSGSAYQQVLKERNEMKGEAEKNLKNVKVLVKLTERCGERLRDLEGKNDALVRQVAKLQRSTGQEKTVYHEAKRLAARLLVKVDELNAAKDELQEQAHNGDCLLTKSRQKVKLLERERKLLIRTRGPEIEQLLKALYLTFRTENDRLPTGPAAPDTARAYFKGFGTNSSIPLPLRYTGRVKNLKIGKGTIERYV